MRMLFLMRNLSWDFPRDSGPGIARVLALPVNTNLFENIGSTELGPVLTIHAFSTVVPQTGITFPTTRQTVLPSCIALATLPITRWNTLECRLMAAAMIGLGTEVTADQLPSLVANVALVIVFPSKLSAALRLLVGSRLVCRPVIARLDWSRIRTG